MQKQLIIAFCHVMCALAVNKMICLFFYDIMDISHLVLTPPVFRGVVTSCCLSRCALLFQVVEMKAIWGLLSTPRQGN